MDNGGGSNTDNSKNNDDKGGPPMTAIISAILVALAVGLVAHYIIFVRRRHKTPPQQQQQYDDTDDHANTRNLPRSNRMPMMMVPSENGPGGSAGVIPYSDSGGAVRDDEWYDQAGSFLPVVSHAATSSPLSGKEFQFYNNNNGDDVSTLGEPLGLASDATRYDESTASVQLSYVQHEAASHPSQAHFGRGGDRHDHAATTVITTTAGGGGGGEANQKNKTNNTNRTNLLPVFDVNDEMSFEARLQPGNTPDGVVVLAPGVHSSRVTTTAAAVQQQQQLYRPSGIALFGTSPDRNNNHHHNDHINSTSARTINSSTNSSSLEGLKFLNGEGATVDSSVNSSSLDGLKFLQDGNLLSGGNGKNTTSFQQYQVQVPAGRLGLLLERSTVRAVAPDCVFATRVHIGDVLVAIDERPVQHLSQAALAAVVHETSHQPQRCFTFVRGC